MGKLEEAVASYERALAVDAEDAEGHNALGTVLMRLGRLDEAGARFREAIRLRPDLAEAHNNLAVFEARRGTRTRRSRSTVRRFESGRTTRPPGGTGEAPADGTSLTRGQGS